jgi:hypothetical protein
VAPAGECGGEQHSITQRSRIIAVCPTPPPPGSSGAAAATALKDLLHNESVALIRCLEDVVITAAAAGDFRDKDACLGVSLMFHELPKNKDDVFFA